MKKFKIIDDSGVDYAFLSGFGISDKSWKGQIVKGDYCPSLYAGAVVVEKPFGLSGVYVASKECFEEIK